MQNNIREYSVTGLGIVKERQIKLKHDWTTFTDQFYKLSTVLSEHKNKGTLLSALLVNLK